MWGGVMFQDGGTLYHNYENVCGEVLGVKMVARFTITMKMYVGRC